MSDITQPERGFGDRLVRHQIDILCDEFEVACSQGETPDPAELLPRVAHDQRALLFNELLNLDLHYRRTRGEAPSAEDYHERFPEFAAEIEAAFSEPCQETVDVSTERVSDTATQKPDRADVREAGEPPRKLGDYELIEEIARGGMGIVYRARQISLNRVVALKMIKSGELAGAEQVERFRQEAEAAANLDHPGIVPIYEVGEQDGRQYFSMALVEGKGLDAHLAGGPLPPREAAELVEQTSRAVGYAHERGVIHRDLKPGNILLASEGGRPNDDSGSTARAKSSRDAGRRMAGLSPRVTDFGLAKRIEADSDLTTTGQILGTPSYMPPEQARGEAEINSSADVYSLGAVLYCCLTGRPPFQAPTLLDTLRQVVEREPVAPRTLNQAVDRDLDAICLKCLEKVPSRRYRNAIELADDLRRFLAGQTTLARPVTRLELLRRWCRRNPLIAALSTTALGLLVALTIVFAAAYAMTSRANTRLDAANAELKTTNSNLISANARETQSRLAAQRNAAEARANLLKSQRLVDEILVRFSDSRELLRGTPGAEHLRKELLALAQDYYEDFVGTTDEDTFRLGHAKASKHLGGILFALGDHRGAETAFRKAEEITLLLRSRNANDSDSQCSLAEVRDSLASLLQVTGRNDEAEQTYQSAREMWGQLAKTDPSPRNRAGMAATCSNQGAMYLRLGRSNDAIPLLEKAIALQRQAVQDQPAIVEYDVDLAGYCLNLGNSLFSLQKLAEAEKNYRESLESWDNVIRRYPTVPEYQGERAKVYLNLAAVLQKAGRLPDAEEVSRRAIDIQQELVRQNPFVVEFQHALAGSHFNHAMLLQTRGAHAEAESSFLVAVENLNQLTAAHEEVPLYRQQLADALRNLHLLISRQGRPQEALPLARRELAVRIGLVKADDSVVRYEMELAATYYNLGLLNVSMGLLADAEHDYKAALEIRDRIVEADPEALDHQFELARLCINLGNVYQRQEKSDDAMELWKRSRGLWQHLVRKQPGSAPFQMGFARISHNLGALAMSAGKFDEARSLLQQAVQIRARLAELLPHVAQLQFDAAESHAVLATIMLETRDLDAAEGRFEQAIRIHQKLINDHPAETRYQVGLVYALFQSAAVHRVGGAYDKALRTLQQASEQLDKVLLKTPDHPDAVRFRTSINRALAHTHNDRAWRLATSPEPSERDGKRAIEDASRACELADWSDAGFLDTLAAAHAEAGNFQEAVRWARKAMALADDDLEPQLQARLRRYEDGLPFHEVRP